jgi:hypothetical protein
VWLCLKDSLPWIPCFFFYYACSVACFYHRSKKRLGPYHARRVSRSEKKGPDPGPKHFWTAVKFYGWIIQVYGLLFVQQNILPVSHHDINQIVSITFTNESQTLLQCIPLRHFKLSTSPLPVHNDIFYCYFTGIAFLLSPTIRGSIVSYWKWCSDQITLSWFSVFWEGSEVDPLKLSGSA